MIVNFQFQIQMPSLNNITNKAKKSPHSYNLSKQNLNNIITKAIINQQKLPLLIKEPITPLFGIVSSQNYDHDNIKATTFKIILDALQNTSMIANDNHSIITSSYTKSIINKSVPPIVFLTLVSENLFHLNPSKYIHDLHLKINNHISNHTK